MPPWPMLQLRAPTCEDSRSAAFSLGVGSLMQYVGNHNPKPQTQVKRSSTFAWDPRVLIQNGALAAERLATAAKSPVSSSSLACRGHPFSATAYSVYKEYVVYVRLYVRGEHIHCLRGYVVYIYIYTYIHMCMHVYIHTCIYTYVYPL